jgi:hypothetical protein
MSREGSEFDSVEPVTDDSQQELDDFIPELVDDELTP